MRKKTLEKLITNASVKKFSRKTEEEQWWGKCECKVDDEGKVRWEK